MSSAPPALTQVWALNLDDPDWETGAGEVLVNHAGTVDAVGIDGTAPTITATSSEGGGMALDRRWSLPAMGLGVLAEVYLRFRVHIDTDMLTLDPFAGKIGGLWGQPDNEPTPLAAGGVRPDGAWSARIMLTANGKMGTYIYAEHPTNGQYPYGVAASRAWWQAGWNEVLMHVRMNTPGENNGVLRLWLNDSLVNVYDDVQWIPGGFGDQAGIYLTGPHWFLNEWETTPAGLVMHFADIELLTPA